MQRWSWLLTFQQSKCLMCTIFSSASVRQEIIILRHKLTEGLSQGESSEALRRMQDELQRLQVQVGR